MIVHDVDGCAPTPLAHYLKALGILRLVTEQADSQARGWWVENRFKLATSLSRDDLLNFFLERYEPTPLVSPWNKGSGFFYAGDPGLSPVEGSIAPRFGRLRAGINDGRSLLGELVKADQAVRAIKSETKDKKLSKMQKKLLKESPEYKKRLAAAEKVFKIRKADFIRQVRLHLRGSHREWIDAAMVLDDDGAPLFPALLGTGGNDGRLDFSNNYLQRLNEIFELTDPTGQPKAAARRWFESALWGVATNGLQSGSAVGQYFPGLAGGANNSSGPEAESLLNPVDFLLLLEGSVLFTAHATRRLGTVEQSRAAAPFAVNAHGAGYASAADADESARGEQWMPLWAQPIKLDELRRLLAEGRAQIGTHSAREPLDLARAVTRLGVARGIAAFQRYGYIERNGQSNLAVPLGRFNVSEMVASQTACLDDIAVWATRVKRQAADKGASAHLRQVSRRLGDVFFDSVQRTGQPAVWQALLLAIGAVESVMRCGAGFRAGPAPPLRPEWVEAADDGSSEFRLALSFALQARGFRSGTLEPLDSVRRHWLPLNPQGSRDRFAVTGDVVHQRLDKRPEVVMQGRRGLDDAVALVERRIVEGSGSADGLFGLRAAPRAVAEMPDLCAWLQGRLDADRTLSLARALMALDRSLWAQQIVRRSRPGRDVQWPDDAWLCIRLAHLPWPLSDGRKVPCDPAIGRRLASGDAASAVQLALRRLHGAGIRPAVRAASVPADTARLWAAALAFPISTQTANRMAARLNVTPARENHA